MTTVLLALPVYNEKKVLYKNTKRILNYISQVKNYDFHVLIVDNGSKDGTRDIAQHLVNNNPNVNYQYLKLNGRGNALRTAWQNSKCDITCYIDIDLSTSLNNIKDLLKQMTEGADICIGSRYLKKSHTHRTFIRLLFSKVYNLLIKIVFNVNLTDFQCGFKAINQKTVRNILPLTQNNEWFFDTELIILAHSKKYNIKEIAIRWKENPNTKVKLVNDSVSYISEIIKFKKRLKEINL